MKTHNLLPIIRGLQQPSQLFTHATLFNPFTCEWNETSFSVTNGLISGIGDQNGGQEIDLHNAKVIPGLIDAHVHVESSLLSPAEFGRIVLKKGTTTVIADPHEIANVCGVSGIEYFYKEAEKTPLDILFMAPSCVPATPLDESFEVIDAKKLKNLSHRVFFQGLGEMMNVPGVLNLDPDVLAKLDLFKIRDGHAPFLRGKNLQAYICAGIQSDHETTSSDEASEKLSLGMSLYLREGSTERNLTDLIPAVTCENLSQCSFCTDDRHGDMICSSGHIDDCIRKAIDSGLEPEYAIRMATLSPAGRFNLQDRGALIPGRIADFCILKDKKPFEILKTYKRGYPVQEILYQKPSPLSYVFRKRIPEIDEITISGEGNARVIGINPGQIATESLHYDISGDDIGDTKRDILKVVVASRYSEEKVGLGLIHGLKVQEGAIACSIAHDSHHIIATGTDDTSIINALREVIRTRGGMTCVTGGENISLPLPIAGLMSDLHAENVNQRLNKINQAAENIGAIESPFMYLSFVSLTVIPKLRITPDGLFDAVAFAHVPLFTGETNQ